MELSLHRETAYTCQIITVEYDVKTTPNKIDL